MGGISEVEIIAAVIPTEAQTLPHCNSISVFEPIGDTPRRPGLLIYPRST